MFRNKTNCVVAALVGGLVLAAVNAPASAQGFWDHRVADGPPARWISAMAYDSCRDVSVLFGGDNSGSGFYFEDTWEWDGETWVLRATTGPGVHRAHAMAFDEGRCVTVLFGGVDVAGAYINDTWEWDGTAWTERFPSVSPAPRSGPGVAYDSTRGVILLFGGWSPGGYFNDLWQWNGTSWQQVPTTSPRPSPRASVAMAYDANRDRMVIFGGQVVPATCAANNTTNETWELDMSTSPATWTQIAPSTQPSSRKDAALVYDTTQGVMLLFGGSDYCNVLFGDTWEWDGNTWTQVMTITGPSPRYTQAMAYDAVRKQVVLFGGLVSGEPNPWITAGDTWTFGTCLPRGDMNGDGLVNGLDLSFFVAKLLNP